MIGRLPISITKRGASVPGWGLCPSLVPSAMTEPFPGIFSSTKNPPLSLQSLRAPLVSPGSAPYVSVLCLGRCYSSWLGLSHLS